MTIEELAKLAKSAREAQKRYFRERTPQLLNESKGWERRLDEAVESVLNPKAPGLFDEPIKEVQ